MADEFEPSQPELAIFVLGAANVIIQNCTLSGFDFGIIVAQSKNVNISPPPPLPPPPLGTLPSPPPLPGPPLNQIVNNTINVRTNAITIMNSDQVLAEDS